MKQCEEETAFHTWDTVLNLTLNSMTDPPQTKELEALAKNISRLQNLQNLKIYPNPTTDILNIERKQSKKLSILLQDKLGRVLLSQESEQTLTELNMRDFLPGIYYLSVNDGVLREVYKVVRR